MPFDDLVLGLQRTFDHLIRRLRLGPPPAPGQRRLLIVQIDGLSRSVLEQAMARGRAPFLARLLRRQGYRMAPMCVGLPSSTPAFQLAAMYGVRPDIPGFHYYDKRRKADVYFPRGGDAAHVEQTQAAGRRGIVSGGGTYGCVFTGGAASNLLTFAMIKRPTGAGLIRAASKLVVLAWVLVKGMFASTVEVVRALLRRVADPLSESSGTWKWLALKLGISVWLRELFTLAVAHDIYAGVPTIYVNYLDYDVAAHAWGPRHPRALQALRRVDASIRRLWRVLRRVPEYRYDLYVLSDHGQAASLPYIRIAGGRPIEQSLFEDFFDVDPADAVAAPAGRGGGLAALRAHRAPGLFQRFVNYLEHDFPWVLGGMHEVREHGGIRVVAAGPNAFVYFVEIPEPLTLEGIEARYPGLPARISAAPGIGLVLVRSAAGPLCFWRGSPYTLETLGKGPFAERTDLERVVEGIGDLMAMPSAGDLVIYGTNAPQGNVSFVAEVGAHAGPSVDELHTFLIHPPSVTVPAPIVHPVQLYPHFARYQADTA
ncbi:MAG: alkaline phosphatase family protein [Candidatus Rokuibacteriota bacterium]